MLLNFIIVLIIVGEKYEIIKIIEILIFFVFVNILRNILKELENF